MKIPIPIERRGEGACIVGGGGLLLRSRVSTSEIESLLRRPRGRFSDPCRLGCTGDASRDSDGLANGSVGGS